MLITKQNRFFSDKERYVPAIYLSGLNTKGNHALRMNKVALNLYKGDIHRLFVTVEVNNEMIILKITNDKKIGVRLYPEKKNGQTSGAKISQLNNELRETFVSKGFKTPCKTTDVVFQDGTWIIKKESMGITRK
jgi:hypothetical protein